MIEWEFPFLIIWVKKSYFQIYQNLTLKDAASVPMDLFGG